MTRCIMIGGIGYITAAAGFLAGNVFFLVAGLVERRASGRRGANRPATQAASPLRGGRRLYGTILGFTAGLLLAFVCLSMLPEVFAESGLAAGVAGLAAGMAAAFFLEGRTEKMERWKRAGLLMALGVSLHNIPEGMALGAMLSTDRALGVSMAVIISMHCFPEALSVLTPMRLGGLSGAKTLLYSLVLALPMCLGAFAGGLAGGVWPGFASLCMSFAGGVMLYMACGDILPESKDVWRGRLSTIGAMAGFLAGTALTGRLM